MRNRFTSGILSLSVRSEPPNINQEEFKMTKLFYEEILVGEITTNKSLTVQEALEQIEFDEQKFITEQGFDDIDYNDFKLIY